MTLQVYSELCYIYNISYYFVIVMLLYSNLFCYQEQLVVDDNTLLLMTIHCGCLFCFICFFYRIYFFMIMIKMVLFWYDYLMHICAHVQYDIVCVPRCVHTYQQPVTSGWWCHHCFSQHSNTDPN